MRERYCFFNVDGLLNRSSDWNKPFTINYELAKAFCFFLSSNSLIPVLSSSWRIGFNKANDEANAPYIKELEGIFSECGLKIHDKTPFLRGRTREKEIERFLYFNRPGNYIVIDGDREEYAKYNDHVIFINPDVGFTVTDAKKAGKLLHRLDKKIAG